EVNRTRAVVPSRGDVATADEVRPHAGRRRPGSEAGEREKEVAARTGHGHFASTMRLISCGEANTMDVRSPCMPAGTSTGLPREGHEVLRHDRLRVLDPAVEGRRVPDDGSAHERLRVPAEPLDGPGAPAPYAREARTREVDAGLDRMAGGALPEHRRPAGCV